MAFVFQNDNDDGSDNGDDNGGDYATVNGNSYYLLMVYQELDAVLYIFDITESSWWLYKVLLLFPFYRWGNKDKLLINGD